MNFRLSLFLISTALLTSSLVQSQELPTAVTPASPSQKVEFNVYLPLQHEAELNQLLDEQQRPGSPNFHKWLKPSEFRERFGSRPEDIAALSEMLAGYGFTVVGRNSHGVHVEGTTSAVAHAFGASLVQTVTSSGKAKLVARDPLTFPGEMQNMGAQIVHFSRVRDGQPQVHRVSETVLPANRTSPFGGYWFDDLKQAYDFPSYRSLTGAGRTIAIMSVSDYLESDLVTYFGHESTRSAPIQPPRVVRYFPLGTGAPFNAQSGFSFETELDLEQAGGMAPGATLLLVDLPDSSSASFLDGYFSLVENNAADIVNSSYLFGAEALFTAAYNGGQDYTGILAIFNDVFKQGNAQGITFVESSGDNGGLALPPLDYFTKPPQNPPVIVGHFLPGVQTFNTSWHVTSVGGTNLHTTYDPPSLESNYVGENANGDPEVPYDPYGVGNLVAGGYWGSGGGESIIYSKPPFQEFINTRTTRRAVPDISLQMGGCPSGLAKVPCHSGDSYVYEVFGGKLFGAIGTSASAPEFAGMLALKEQYLGGARLGNVNYEIYTIAAAQPELASTPLDFLHQGQTGFNGAFHTTKTGYNLVLGVGTPLVRNFIFAPEIPAAGNPQTRSNP